MKKILFLFGFLFLSGIGFAFANQGLSTKEFEIGQEIEINGNGFGEYGLYSYLCFNSDESCLGYKSSGIISWTDTKIVFNVPLFAVVGGDLMVYNTNITEPMKYTYKIKPKIFGIFNDNGDYINIGCNTETINIVGVGFGKNLVGGGGGSKVSIGDKNMKIESWSSQTTSKILTQLGFQLNDDFVQTIKVKLDVEKGKVLGGLYFQNSAGLGLYYNDFRLNGNVTDDQYSCLQNYLYSISMDKVFNTKVKKGDGIVVAVIDDGVNHNHLDFKNKLRTNSDEIPNNNIDDDKNGYIDDVYGWNFSRNSNRMDAEGGHGTMVAGIIAAEKDNGLGISGIAPNSKIMPLLVFKDGDTDVSYITKAIKYATDNGANIINLSLGGKYTDSYSTDFDSAIAYAYNKGVVIVSSAGNGDFTNQQDRDLDIYKSSPVCNDGKGVNYVLGVGSVDDGGVKATFSDYGSCIDISAPGVDIVSLSHNAFSEYNIPYDKKSGTSFSAPMVAGAIAVLRSNNGKLTNDQIYKMIINHGDSLDENNLLYKGKIGKMLNIEKLLSYPIPERVNDKIPTTSINNNNTEEVFQSTLDWMYNNGLTKYNQLTEFKPKSNITREQAAKFFTQFGLILKLSKSENGCEFKDIAKADYTLIPFIIEACNYNLLKGSMGQFRPFDSITKAEAITVVMRSLQGFKDESLDPWYLNYYSEAINLGLTSFSLDELNDNITREEMGTLVYLASKK